MGGPTLLDTNEIAIVDFGKLANATHPLETSKEILKISDELKEAFSQRRVVYIINHGISEKEMNNIYLLMDKFLALPDTVKEEFRSKGSADPQGYMPQNTEQFYERNKFEVRESFNNVGANRHYPSEHIPEFPKFIDVITKKLVRVTNLLLELFAIGMGVNSDFLLNCHKNIWKDHHDNKTTLRILHYPAIKEEPHTGITRCGEHTDYGTFTLLMQDSEGGLEVCGENGEWRQVGHIPGGIFLNTADLLEIWTGGEYKATKHRVVVPDEKSTRTRSRYSLAFFVIPDNTTTVKPVHPEAATEVKECNAEQYINNLLNRSGIV